MKKLFVVALVLLPVVAGAQSVTYLRDFETVQSDILTVSKSLDTIRNINSNTNILYAYARDGNGRGFYRVYSTVGISYQPQEYSLLMARLTARLIEMGGQDPLIYEIRGYGKYVPARP